MNPNILATIVVAVFALVLSSTLYVTHRHGYSTCQQEHTEAAVRAIKEQAGNELRVSEREVKLIKGVENGEDNGLSGVVAVTQQLR